MSTASSANSFIGPSKRRSTIRPSPLLPANLVGYACYLTLPNCLYCNRVVTFEWHVSAQGSPRDASEFVGKRHHDGIAMHASFDHPL
jgi:hypothetical protein